MDKCNFQAKKTMFLLSIKVWLCSLKPSFPKHGIENTKQLTNVQTTSFSRTTIEQEKKKIMFHLSNKEKRHFDGVPFSSTPLWKVSFLDPSLAMPMSLVPIPTTLWFSSYRICRFIKLRTKAPNRNELLL